MIESSEHHHATDAALAARYRQRRLSLLAVVVLVTVVPIVALGTWWMWPLLVIPAALAAPLAGGTGLIATLLACAIGLAAASGGQVTSAEVLMGFVAIIVVAALGAAHAGMGQGVMAAMPSFGRGRDGAVGPAPGDVFDIIAARDCRRAAETGTPVSVAIIAVPRVQWIADRHGNDVLDHLLEACSGAVAGVTSGSDLVMEQSDGRYVALVPGTAEAARELAERVAMALEGVAVRDHDGLRVTAGSVGIGVAQWRDGDTGPDALIERAGAALQQDMARDTAPGDDQVTGEFRSAPIADAA